MSNPEIQQNPKLIYTVGHSNHPFAEFLALLATAQINCVVDVRRTPFSRHNPQFNREVLQAALPARDLVYLHFGREFGARHTRPELLDPQTGRVDFEKVQQTPAFHKGVMRLRDGLSKGFRIALLCAEADPFFCHRFGMISGYLVGHGWQVRHILPDRSVIDNAVLEQRLLRTYAAALPPDLFEPPPEPAAQLARAYRLHNREIGYRPPAT